jgi:phage terminase small subunit
MKRTKFSPESKEKKRIKPFTSVKKIIGNHTNKQNLFCHYYISHWNGTQAAISAGYSKKTAGVIACELLKKPNIQEYIKQIQQDIEKEVGISKIGRLKQLKIIADADLTDLFDDWLTRKELDQIKKENPGLTKAIKSTERKLVNKTDPLTGEPFTEEYLKVEFKDSLRAEEMLFKAMGWNEPESVNVFIEQPLFGDDNDKEENK